MKRSNGVLLHVSSLPSKYGIGDFGKNAYEFIDYLSLGKVKNWQVLPLNQTGYSNSPYQSECAYSFSPYFISPEILYNEKLVTKAELNSLIYKGKTVDYGFLYFTRYPFLRKAFSRFDRYQPEFISFKKKKEFFDYALYMAIKTKNGNTPFYAWENGLKFREEKAIKTFIKENAEEIDFWLFLQFKAQEQWTMLKGYANSQGVSIIGDMPLYIAYDSVEVWKDPNLFKLDENLNQTKVAGVPPDYFSATGQLWGNPVYNYEEHIKDGFKWWKSRLKTALNKFDVVRIDHFRGLDRYYEIDAGSQTAINGEWIVVPSDELFSALKTVAGSNRIVAEDLGIIDDGVIALLEKTGYSGMAVLSFAFNGESDNKYLPENIKENTVCYTGTHDNDTLIGLITSMSEWDKNNLINGVKNSLKLTKTRGEVKTDKSLAKSIIRLGAKSKARLFIVPLTDLLLLDGSYRMNEPGAENQLNWCVKLTKRQMKKSAIKTFALINEKYDR